jgi:hypothetical protein
VEAAQKCSFAPTDFAEYLFDDPRLETIFTGNLDGFGTRYNYKVQ